MVLPQQSHGNMGTKERIRGQTSGAIPPRYPRAVAHHCFCNVDYRLTRGPRMQRDENRNLKNSGPCGNQLFLGSCPTTLVISPPDIISITCILRRRHRRRNNIRVRLSFGNLSWSPRSYRPVPRHNATCFFSRTPRSFFSILISLLHFTLFVCALTGVGVPWHAALQTYGLPDYDCLDRNVYFLCMLWLRQ